MPKGSERLLFTTKQAADYLGLTRDSIYKYVYNGRLKRVARERGSNGQSQHLYLKEDVELLLRHIEKKNKTKVVSTRRSSGGRELKRWPVETNNDLMRCIVFSA